MERMQTHRLRGPGVKGSREEGVGKLEGVRPGRAGSLLGDGVAAGPEGFRNLLLLSGLC